MSPPPDNKYSNVRNNAVRSKQLELELMQSIAESLWLIAKPHREAHIREVQAEQEAALKEKAAEGFPPDSEEEE